MPCCELVVLEESEELAFENVLEASASAHMRCEPWDQHGADNKNMASSRQSAPHLGIDKVAAIMWVFFSTSAQHQI